MNKKEFEKILMSANFSKKEFASVFDISHQTVVNWGNGKNIPYWVESWLINYIELQEEKREKELYIGAIESLKKQLSSKEALVSSMDDKNLNGLVGSIQKEFRKEYDNRESMKNSYFESQSKMIKMQGELIENLTEKVEKITKFLEIENIKR